MNEKELKFAIAAGKEALAHMVNRRRMLKNMPVVNETCRIQLLNRYRLDILHLTNEISDLQSKLFKLQRGRA